MRLIDADRFRRFAHEQLDEYNVYSVDEIFEMIDEQPTVEAKPVEWIPCSERLPEEPNENPIFEGNPLELYLVSVKYADYPFRAFWNGKFFTDGFSKLKVIAWMPLPAPYNADMRGGKND